MRALATLALALGLAAQEPPPPWEVPAEPGHFLRPEELDTARLLPSPPGPGSLGELADLETVAMAQAFRSPEQEAFAREVDRDTVWKAGACLGPRFRAELLPRTALFFWKLTVDVHGLSEHVKRLHDRPRPPRLDGRIRPCVPLPPNASYPSGHALQAFVRAEVLSDLVPERAGTFRARAHRAAWARILGGVHHPTDDAGGQRLAAAFVAALRRSPAYREALAACRAELEAQRLRAAGATR